MTTRIFCLLATLVTLAVSTPAIAQLSSPPPANAPAANYPPPPPANYQAPGPVNSQPPPPAYYPAAPPPTANYQPPNYLPRNQASAPAAPAQPPVPGQPAPAGSSPEAPAYASPGPPAYYPEQPRSVQEQSAPYHVHRDARHGHEHVYPDRGSVVREVPRGALVINYAGLTYQFYEGVWYEARGPVYIVVDPPIGLVVATLPAFATPVTSGAESYLYANDVYYRGRPDIGGYEVVNDPMDSAAPAAVSAMAAAVPVPNAQALPAAAAVASAPVANAPMTSAPVAYAPVASAPVANAPMTSPAVYAPVTSAPTAPQVASAAVPLANAAMTNAAAAPAAVVNAPSGGTPAPNAPGRSVYAYPKNGQSADQQARDRYDCYRFAVAQTGFDPLRQSGGASAQGGRQADFARAQAACFEGRGYTLQ